MGFTTAKAAVSVAATGARHARERRRAVSSSLVADIAPAGATMRNVSSPSGPPVSILVPAWNHRHFLGSCLDSALAQSYEQVEVVVVDDCSTDGSHDIALAAAERDPRLKLWRNDENRGAFINSIRCLELATHEHVMFLGADDVLRESAVSRLVTAISSDPDAVISFGKFGHIDERGDVLDLSAPGWWYQAGQALWQGRDAGSEMLRRCRNLIGSPTAVLFKRSALFVTDALPGGPVGRQPLFDVLWWLRILSRGAAAPVADVLSDRREHRSSTSNSRGAHARLVAAWEGMILEGMELGLLDRPDYQREAWSSLILLAGGLAARPTRWAGTWPSLGAIGRSMRRATQHIASASEARP